MGNICPYCGCEMEYLEVVKEEITWNGESWQKDDKAVSAIRCPECSDELDTGDLVLLGVPVEIVERGNEKNKKLTQEVISRMKGETKVKTVTFKDEGQDFLEWDIDFSEHADIGKVVASRPFQSRIWVGTEVYQSDIRPGDLLPIVTPGIGKTMTLKHPVESVKNVGS